MNKITLWALGLSLLAACQSNKANQPAQAALDGYVIRGTVQNAPDSGYVVLETLEAQTPRPLDSAQVGPEGAFTLNGELSEDGFYRLNLFGQQFTTLVLDNEADLTVTANLAADGQPTVAGSAATDQLRRLEGMQQQLVELQQEYQRAAAQRDAARMSAIEADFNTQREANVNAAKAIIDSMGTSVVSLYAVNFLNPATELDYLDTLVARFQAERPDSKYTEQFAQMVAQQRQEVAGEVRVGTAAPDFTLPTPDGAPLSLSDLRGKYVLIDFWASWCGPCRRENPNVVRMYQAYQDKDFEILGVSLDRNRDKWLAAIEKDQLTWEHVSDLKFWSSEAARLYNVRSIPATFLVDKDGIVVAKNLRGAALEAKLAEVL